MINKLHLLWVPNFIALGIYFFFGTKCSWNEGLILVLMSKVLLGGNFDFLGGYCLLHSAYYWLLLVTWWLLLVIARYGSFPLLVWTEKLLLSYEICELFKSTFFTEQLRWLLLNVMNSSSYMRVSPVVAKK